MDRDQGQDHSGEGWDDHQLEAIKAYGAEVRDELREQIQRGSHSATTDTKSLTDLVDETFAMSFEKAEATRRRPVGASTG